MYFIHKRGVSYCFGTECVYVCVCVSVCACVSVYVIFSVCILQLYLGEGGGEIINGGFLSTFLFI